MTLYRQLLIFTLVLFILLFAGVWIEKLSSTRTFLMDQLESHAQDTATSLGLSLSPIMAEEDRPTLETMMNAIFDRGYYRTIRLEDMAGQIISERSTAVKFAGVPAWFVGNVRLDTPVAESLVMSGWTQAGRLFVISHPGYAYRTLWQTVVKISSYFLGAVLTVLLGGGFALRLLLKPLKQVEQQAESICRREYPIQSNIPKTRELRQVVESMNRMTARVRDMFAEQARLAERLRSNAYSDHLTGLGNRRYLNGQVEASLHRSGLDARGSLLLIQVNNLQEINDSFGFVEGDDLIKRVAEILRSESEAVSNVAAARLTGGNFALFMPENGREEATAIGEKLCSRLAGLAMGEVSVSDNVANIGGVYYEGATDLSQLLAGADSALRAAARKGPNNFQVDLLAGGSDDLRGRSWWKETLDRVFARQDVVLYGQSVVESGENGDQFHLELLSRIVIDDDEVVSAGVFIPLAERLQVVSRLDRIMMSKALVLSENMPEELTLAVNLSPSSLNDPEFIDWLLGELKRRRNTLPKFNFELAEFGAVLHLEAVRTFSFEIQKLGHGLGLDHFGQSFTNFGYLKSLQPDYVKIDRGFTDELKREQGDAQFFIGALCSVAHSLDIRVIAEGVETEEQLEALRGLNVDAFQGYLFSKPEKLESRP